MGWGPPWVPLGRVVPHLGRLGRATRWRRVKGRPRVWAHRGDSAHAPENTMLAFDRARAAGADGIELDVRFDADDTVVVFHDSALERLTGHPGTMEATRASERQLLRVRGEPVPTLAEVLDTIPIEINVEIKSNKTGRERELAKATAKVIKDHGAVDRVIVSSFDPFALVQLHYYLPEAALGALFHDHQGYPLRHGWVGTWIGASLVHPQHTLVTESSVARWHRAGLPINVWTVDDEAELRRLAALGVDGVIANDPSHALAVLSRVKS